MACEMRWTQDCVVDKKLLEWGVLGLSEKVARHPPQKGKSLIK